MAKTKLTTFVFDLLHYIHLKMTSAEMRCLCMLFRKLCEHLCGIILLDLGTEFMIIIFKESQTILIWLNMDEYGAVIFQL